MGPRPIADLLPGSLWLAFGSALAVVIGTLMPWINVWIISVSGVQTSDGKVVLVGGLLAGALVFGTRRVTQLYLAAGVCGLACLGTCLYDAVRVFAHADDLPAGSGVGAGLWISLIASGILVAAVVKHRRDGA
jgi:hypothetical protein